MTTFSTENFSSGSQWHRWEPHIHAPGTVLNDQFRGHDAWNRYLTAIESADPPIRALGITDYYSTATYEKTCEAKSQGRLPDCDLIFPNIEMRLAVATARGSFVNIHLLVSPEDPKHLDELSRFLSRLEFSAYQDTFCCGPSDLIRLGKLANSTIISEATALEHGSIQFKVDFGELQQCYRKNLWAQNNILIAVAGGSGDGTSGIRGAADTTIREEIEKFAHVIFVGTPKQREFWLGKGTLSVEQICARFGSLKPCLHGSDAHNHSSIGVPAQNRYSWVKGAVAFDSLRQASLAPSGRAYVGETSPTGAAPSQVIKRVEVLNAPWLRTPTIELNSGLVAIIGPRGSGKTALADIVAAGCNALSSPENDRSFLARAHDHLDGAIVRLHWQDGETTSQSLVSSQHKSWDAYPRARYLSQQFVDELCSSHGVTDGLVGEIERVIFDAHDLSARDGAADFGDLLELRTARYRQARRREEQALAIVSERIASDLEKHKLVDTYKAQVNEKTSLITRLLLDRSKLVAKGSEERLSRLEAVTKAAERVRRYVRHYNIQEQQLLGMQDEVREFRTNRAPEVLRETQQRYSSTGLKTEDWDAFLMDFNGDVDHLLGENLERARLQIAHWKGPPLLPAQPPANGIERPVIGPDEDLETLALTKLEAEISRLQGLVSVDRSTTEKFMALSRRVTEESTLLERLKEKLSDCEGAKARAEGSVAERETGYTRVFEAVLAEESVLAELYLPIKKRLADAKGTLRKLSFSVSRHANVAAWAKACEDNLLDLRQGAFRGRGTLLQHAQPMLKQAWETGTAQDVASAMRAFRERYQADLLEHSPVPRSEHTEYRAWSKRFAQWLYGTEHITLRYSIDYDGVDIRKLSPGTRGIVLLLLYLALDDADDRPLIIDQPEENLDPKSVFDELVGLFEEAKGRRQVIIVTHNANLVVNADADQIIIASVGAQGAGDLPPISYTSGGLESAHIRKEVIGTLEGGEPAFRERARRLRVNLD